MASEPPAVVDTPDARGVTTGRRMGYLDALRGVAVLLVLAEHVGERLSSTFVGALRHGVQVGQMGVMVFFLISGFIIPATLERNQSLRTFWIGRVFRLYPLYWVSLVGALILVGLGRPALEGGPSGIGWIKNATMLQVYLGAPDAVGVYWSLAYELTFYALMSALFILGLHRRTVLWSVVGSLVCIVGAIGFRVVLDQSIPLAVFNLATMFTGTLFFRLSRRTLSLRTVLAATALSMTAGVVVLQFALEGGVVDPTLFGARSLIPMTVAWLGAYAIFMLGLWVWRDRSPHSMRYLGRISYSVYLVQSLVIAAIPEMGPPVFAGALWVVVTIVVSIVTFNLVETPGIDAGRRLVRRFVTERTTLGASNEMPVTRPAA